VGTKKEGGGGGGKKRAGGESLISRNKRKLTFLNPDWRCRCGNGLRKKKKITKR